MKRILGVVSLLVLMYVLLFLSNFDRASKWDNLKNVLNQQAFFAILTIGAGLVIITGGIDLSIGSVIGLSAVGFLVLMRNGIPPIPAFFLILLGGALIGLNHGLWITRLKLQPFLVTLCGLFIYRGLARIFSGDQPIGLQEFGQGHAFFDQLEFLRKTLVGKDMKSVFGFPMQTIVMLVIAILIGIVLHASVYGRYWYAIGHNEQAARYAGINTNRHKVSVYVLCSVLSCLGGMLMVLDYSVATPNSTGSTLELYAITGAVLGGCSLRGGEGTVIGMILGAAVLPLLMNLITFVHASTIVGDYIKNIDSMIPVVIGLTLLLGTLVDQFFRRGEAKRTA